MKIEEACKLVEPFFKMKEMQILEKFANLHPDSVFVKPKHNDYASVFIPGKRKDRALLVAHVDTVWHDPDDLNVGFGADQHAEHGFEFPIFYSAAREKEVSFETGAYVRGYGIGADDRAGVAMLWGMRDMGHSLLLVNGEEHGCLGSGFLTSSPEMMEVLQDHSFAIECDRHGSDDIVFYNVSTKKFREYCKDATKYTVREGSFTDICVICREICGVNISVGYYNEHRLNETLKMAEWLKTYNTLGTWLTKPLPRFPR
jgi:hypothetical protein